MPITLLWRNVELAIQEKGQDWRHKFGDIHFWMVFKTVGMDEPGEE